MQQIPLIKARIELKKNWIDWSIFVRQMAKKQEKRCEECYSENLLYTGALFFYYQLIQKSYISLHYYKQNHVCSQAVQIFFSSIYKITNRYVDMKQTSVTTDSSLGKYWDFYTLILLLVNSLVYINTQKLH